MKFEKGTLADLLVLAGAFGAGLLYDRLKKKQPEATNAGERSQRQFLKEVGEIRNAIDVTLQLLGEIEKLAKAQAILLGVFLEAIRDFDSPPEGIPDLNAPNVLQQIEQQAYDHTFSVLKEAIRQREDLIPAIDLAATMMRKYTKFALESPESSLPTVLPEEIYGLIATGAYRLGKADNSKQMLPLLSQLEQVHKKWEIDKKPQTYRVTLAFLIDGIKSAL